MGNSSVKATSSHLRMSTFQPDPGTWLWAIPFLLVLEADVKEGGEIAPKNLKKKKKWIKRLVIGQIREDSVLRGTVNYFVIQSKIVPKRAP